MPVLELDEQENNHLDSESVKNKAISGAKVMAARTVISFVLRMVSSLTLARLLFPNDYGAFGVVSSITGIGMFLCDMGLGSALMHQNSEPTDNENFTVFVSQQVMTAIIVGAIILASPWLIQAYRMPTQNLGLLICMASSLFLSSLRVIPMMSLERQLRFREISRCELLENVVQVIVTIMLAYLHFGAWSLAGGGLARGVTGLLCVWIVSPWHPRGQFKFRIVRQLAGFGIPIQLSALVPALAGNWCTFTVSRWLNVAAVGYIGWAMNLATVPMMFAAVINRIAFPAYSRLQSDPETMCHYVKTTLRHLFAICCLTVPIAVALCPVVLPLLFNQRWVPAVPLVQWFILDSVVAMLLVVLCTAQNALGYTGDRLAVTIIMLAMRWGIGYLLVSRLGLPAVGPIILIFSLFEMLFTIVLITIRNKHYNGMLTIVFSRLLTMSGILAASTWISSSLMHNNAVLQSVTSLTLFFTCILICERMMTESFVVKEVQQLIKSFRGRVNQRPT